MTCCFLSSLKTLLMAVEPNWLVSLNAPNAYLSLAGFEVTIIGRFWVTAEDVAEGFCSVLISSGQGVEFRETGSLS